ncbi:hypothetical protein PILCRDRAFT_824151 [Piloderma croceum F 1598]|uniref:DRBM domain-containing protein n=1 Tax=Piloderma croceum (strain F 1598) TaxID=765440 RepID=A0A0C3BN37_PILCF|nr:hypothetical protein PILCRDRAFT_824151 [Piloderma croceum F 1598]
MPDDWVVIAYYKKIEYGRGTGSTRDDAAEQAAQQVLVALRGDSDDNSDQERPHANGTAADQAMQLSDTLNSAPEPYKSHFKMTLNNWLQGRYGTSKHLTWDENHTGPADSGSWEVIAYINDIEFGRAIGSTRYDAAESAAEKVLLVLRNY